MNNVLELKGKRFVQASKNSMRGGVGMNGRVEVSTEHLLRLKTQLIQIKEFWDKETKPFEGILISVYYNKIVAKSNRIAGLFKGKASNDAIVGAKFNRDKSKHIITYFLDEYDLAKSIELITDTSNILSQKFAGKISKNIFEDKNIKVIYTAPSLDTKVCSLQTKQLNEAAKKYPNVKFYSVTVDTPFAQERFCTANEINGLKAVSDFKYHQFGIQNGFFVKEKGLLTRALMIVDENNVVKYIEYVPEEGKEADVVAEVMENLELIFKEISKVHNKGQADEYIERYYYLSDKIYDDIDKFKADFFIEK